MSFLDTITDNVSKVADSVVSEGSGLLGGNLVDKASNLMIDSMKSLPGMNELQNMGFPKFDDLLGGGDNMQAASRTQVRDHRSGEQGPTVRDHRGGEQGPIVRDHRSEQGPTVRDHRHEDGNVRDHRQGHDNGRENVRDHRHESNYGQQEDPWSQGHDCACHDDYQRMDFNEMLQNLFGRGGDQMCGGQQGFNMTMQDVFALLSGHPEELLQKLGLGGEGQQGGEKGGGGGLFGDIFGGIKGLLGGGSGGGIGGILGGILGGGEGGGIGGMLGGILGGGEGGGGLLGGILGKIPGMDTLLPIAMKVAPLVLL